MTHFSRRRWTQAASLILGLFVGDASVDRVQADPIAAWRGASVEVDGMPTYVYQEGSVAAGEAAGTVQSWVPVDGRRVTFDLDSYARAEVSSDASRWFTMQFKSWAYTLDRIGMDPMVGTQGSADATASWDQDVVHIRSRDGSALPTMIRLEFQATATSNEWVPAYWPKLPTVSSGGHTVGWDQVVSTGLPNHSLYGTFHVDLLVNSLYGWSGPLNLDVRESLPYVVSGDLNLLTSMGLVLGLKDITTADDTSLLAGGYDVSFDSGLQLQNVPEPGPIAIWGLLILGGGTFARRRRRGGLARRGDTIA